MKKHTTYHLLPTTKSKSKGLTLIELLIVVVILGVLVTVLMWYLRNQPYKARDAVRKSDLKEYVTAFEDYFNDHERYPDEGSIDNCDSNDLDPYVKRVMCDPGVGSESYNYIVDTDGLWYAICAKLENDVDPDIARQGCTNGCGTGLAYNYCTTVGVSITDIGGEVDTGGGGGGGTYGGNYACDPSGVCNNYLDPEAVGCPSSWAESDCQGLCSLPVSTSIPPAIVNPAYACPI